MSAKKEVKKELRHREWAGFSRNIHDPNWNDLALGKNIKILNLQYVIYDDSLLDSLYRMNNLREVNIKIGKFTGETEEEIAEQYEKMISLREYFSSRGIENEIELPEINSDISVEQSE